MPEGFDDAVLVVVERVAPAVSIDRTHSEARHLPVVVTEPHLAPVGPRSELVQERQLRGATSLGALHLDRVLAPCFRLGVVTLPGSSFELSASWYGPRTDP